MNEDYTRIDRFRSRLRNQGSSRRVPANEGAERGGPIGAGVGAIVDMALLTRSLDVYIGAGTPMDMTLGSPVSFGVVKARGRLLSCAMLTHRTRCGRLHPD